MLCEPGTYDIQDRILGCYIDYNTLQVFNPQVSEQEPSRGLAFISFSFVFDQLSFHRRIIVGMISQKRGCVSFPQATTVSETFFYNGHGVLHGTAINGLTWSGNTYALQQYGGDQSIVLADTVERSKCKGVVVDDEINGDSDWRVRTTHARQTLRLDNAENLEFDFSGRLLFGFIDEVTYSVAYSDGAAMVQHGARTPRGTTVRIEFEKATSATVTVDVVQCPYTPGAPDAR